MVHLTFGKDNLMGLPCQFSPGAIFLGRSRLSMPVGPFAKVSHELTTPWSRPCMHMSRCTTNDRSDHMQDSIGPAAGVRTSASSPALIAAFSAYQNQSAAMFHAPLDTGLTSGCCWLVGSGPGPLEHLTLGAAALIQQAEVIFYDDLGTQAAVNAFAPADAERVYVGKRGLQKSIKQHQIDALLVEWCLKGKRVVRLKGGCPSVFSRAASEIDALTAAGIAVHLSPGVSSALAAPLLAGIPLTDKRLSTAFIVTSGHDPSAVDWEAMRGFQTVLFLMAGYSVSGLVKGLQTITSKDLPVAVIREAGSDDQQVWSASLATIVEATKGYVLSPCVIVVGEIASSLQSTSTDRSG